MTGDGQEERQALIAYRLDQADHALRQAEVLAGVEEWDGVVNRAYYAMFYSTLALLLTTWSSFMGLCINGDCSKSQ